MATNFPAGASFPTREPQLAFPGLVNIGALSRLISLRGINVFLFLACLPLRVSMIGIGNFGLGLNGFCSPSGLQALFQQQGLSHQFSLDKVLIFPDICLEFIHSLHCRLHLTVRSTIFQFCQSSCGAKDAYGRFLDALGRLSLSRYQWQQLTFLSSTGVPNDPDDLDNLASPDDPRSPRTPSQRVDNFDTPGENHSACSDDCRGEVVKLPVRLKKPPQPPCTCDSSFDLDQEPDAAVRQTAEHLCSTQRQASQSRPQQLEDPPKQLSTPPRCPPKAPHTSAAAPAGCSAPAHNSAGAIVETASKCTSGLDHLSEPCDICHESVAARDVRPGQHDNGHLVAHPVRLKPTALPCPSANASAALPRSEDSFERQPLPGATSCGFTTAAGEPKGKQRDGAAPRISTGASNTKGKRNAAGHPVAGTTRDGADGDQSEDDNGQEPRADANKEVPTKKHKTLPFRCPKHAADPQSCSARCPTWTSWDIGSVTRHAKADAKADPQKLKQIEDLSHTKLSPPQRWGEYFLIFNGGVKTEQMKHPYWIGPSPTDPTQQLVQLLMKEIISQPVQSQRVLDCLQEINDLQSAKTQREAAIENKSKQAILDIEMKASADRANSDVKHQRALEALIARFAENRSSADFQDQDDTPMPEPSTEPQESMLLHTVGNAADRTPTMQDDDEVGDAVTMLPFHQPPYPRPTVVPTGDPKFLINTMVEHGNQDNGGQPVDEYIAKHTQAFHNGGVPARQAASPAQQFLQPWSPWDYSNPQQSQFSRFSDPGYASNSFTQDMNETQSSIITSEGNFQRAMYDQGQQRSFQQGDVHMGGYVNPVDLQNHGAGTRRF